MSSIKPSTFWQERRQPRKGRQPDDHRGAYEKDRSRVIHSAAFRRLQSKTQILGVLEGDFHRTRLTHSMEVAQIGRGLVLQLRKRYPEKQELLPELETIETIGLAHDLGHPPFGHGGEVALNCMMHGYGGFESNAQSLRLLGVLESHTPGYGLNLTRRAMLGVLKYPAPYSVLCRSLPEQFVQSLDQVRRKDWVPPKCYMDAEQSIIDWLFESLTEEDRKCFMEHTPVMGNGHGHTLHQSLDTSILNLADDIAYGVHDLEDSIALRLFSRDHWSEIQSRLDAEWAREMNLVGIEEQLFSISQPNGHYRKQAVGALVNALILSVELKRVPVFKEPLLAWRTCLSTAPQNFLEALKDSVSQHVIQLNTVQTATYRGHRILLSIFQVLLEEADRLLPDAFRHLWQQAENESLGRRVICDYMAGMTDQYSNRMFARLFLPGEGSVFDRI